MKKYAFAKTKLSNSLLILVALATALLSPIGALAENKNDPVFSELERIKNEKALYNQGLADLYNQSYAIMLSLDETKDLISKNRDEMLEMEKNLRTMQEELAKKRTLKAELIKKLYTDGYQGKIFTIIFGSDSITDSAGNENKLKKLHGRSVDQIKKISEEEKQAAQDIDLATIRRKNLQEQIDMLENQLAYIGRLIEEKSSKLGDMEENESALESQLLNTGVKIDTKNKRDFLNWNKVNFEKEDSITFYGSGTAHGIGMSQYGAMAMALKGKNYKTILGHYYQKTKVGKIDTDKTIVRVELSASPYGGNIIVRGGTADFVNPDGKNVLLRDGESVSTQPGTRVVPNEGSTRLELDYKNDMFNTYRGVIEIAPDESGKIITVNHVYIEDYLKSVISGEMSARWPQEALKAQAVAARSYAYKNLNGDKRYDICDSAACQVYLGASHEFEPTNRAVDSTRGEMVYYNDEIITAYYFSSSGGWTENNENVWGGAPRPYLRGVPSPDEQSPYNSWKTGTLTKDQIENILNRNTKTKVGGIKSIEIAKRGVSGRVMSVKITGSEGEKFVTGYTFKTIVNMGIQGGDNIKEVLFGIK